MRSIVLDKMDINKNKIDYYFSIEGKIQKYFNKKNYLFFEYNHNISILPKSILAIPFVANIAPLAWITDSTIKVNELDKSFYDCLSKIKKAYQNMYPNVSFKGKIIVENIVCNSYIPQYEAAQLFSGGLDALATYIRIKEKNPLLITEYGWHKEKTEENAVWEKDKTNVVGFAIRNELENILIHSNYGTFIKAQRIDSDFQRKLGDSWWHGLHHGLAIITAAIPTAFKFKVECIYIASSYFEGYKAKCASDPTVDNNIRFASGKVFHDGYEINRQDKVKIVVDYYSKMKELANLRVCFRKEENCCNCEKCVRTILGIVAEGKNPSNFGFNIPEDLSIHVQSFLEENVKYFTPARVMQWNLAKSRMEENQHNILYQDLLRWFLHYNFVKERKKSLLKYRVTKFLPIVKRRISIGIKKMIAENR